MRVSVIGCGHLGVPHAAAMAKLGHEVIGVETDPAKCAALAAGTSYFYEADVDQLLAEFVPSGQLRFTTDLAEAAEFADVHFIAVGTPLRADGAGYDVEQVTGAVATLVPLLRRPAVIVGKSTVTVGTVARLQQIVDDATTDGVELVWNPEFLREGHAVQDTLFPDRILAGVTSDAGREAIEQVYAPILARGEVELIITDPATAEVAKSASNAYLATKISFINAMAEVCEITGANILDVAHTMGIDRRIGAAGMRPGIGYGGGCLPKDLGAFTHRVGEIGATGAAELLTVVDRVNRGRRQAAFNLVQQATGGNLAGKKIGFLGASFKAGTSDVRDSPALILAEQLRAAGADVTVFDPEATQSARKTHPQLTYATSAPEALTGTDVTVIGTEWPAFTTDPKLPVQAAAAGAAPVLVDVRSAVEPGAWLEAGWQIWQLGRPTQNPA